MTTVDPATDDTEASDDEPSERPRVGGWEAAFLGWRVVLPVVVGHALLQAALVLPDPVPALAVGFVGLTLASAAALLLAVWCLVAAATAVVDGRARRAWRGVGRRPVVLAWAAGTGIVAAAASLLSPWAFPVVLALGTFLLPPAATGVPAVRGALRTFGHAPVRSLLLLVVAVVVAALSVAVALLLGLFVTGALSAVLLWLWLGLVGTVLLSRYCVVWRRASGGQDDVR